MGRGVAVVLFTDLVGSTELRGRLGEEAAEELRRAHDRLLAQAVETNGGRVVKGLGDGIMATFAGASDAVAAAVAIQQAVDRLNRSGKTPLPLDVRVGLSAGDVTFEDDDVHGTPVIEASRLCATAAGGEILSSELVRGLAGSNTNLGFESSGPVGLKGLAVPVAACRVRWEPVAMSAIPMPALLTDVGRIFVGRDDQLERLRQLWKEAVGAEPRVALLAGEPGVGKTRLAAELATRVHDEGATVLAGRCDDDLGVPFQPFVEALRHFVDHTRAEDLEARLGRYGGELQRLVPELVEKVPDLPLPLKSDPETERYRLFDAVAAWLATVSVEEPLLLVLDDLQWAAKPTVLLLRHLVRYADRGRVLLVGTYRDTEFRPDHPLVELLADLRGREDIERLSVVGLDGAGVAAYLKQAAGQELEAADLALARAIHAETDGNPFFVREILRHLAETGALERREGRWEARLPVEELGVPDSVREVVGRRIGRLSREANDTLRLAAVTGPEFEVPVVQVGGSLDEHTLLSALDEAAGAGLIIEGNAPRFRFAHALVRDTLYQDLSATRRMALHRRVAEAIETIHAARIDDHLPGLAHHWARAGMAAADTVKAIHYATRAGDRALAQLAHDEAVGYYGQALELLGAGNREDDEPRLLELLIRLGEAQRRVGEAAYRATLLEACSLARRLADTDGLVSAALANSRGVHSATGEVDRDRVEALQAAAAALGPADRPERARVLATLASELAFSGEWDRRRRLSDEAVAVARRVGDDATLVRVLNMRGFVLQVPETARQRLVETAEALEVADRLGDPLERYFALWMRRLVTVQVSDFAEADRLLGEQEQLAQHLGQPTLRWYAMAHRAWSEAFAGRHVAAERLAADALELGTEIGDPDAAPVYAAALFMIRFDQGRLDELEPQLTQVVAANPGLPIFRALLALADCELGRDDEARRLLALDAATAFSGVPYDCLWGACLAAFAYVCTHLGDTHSADLLYPRLAPSSGLLAEGIVFALGAMDHHLATLAATLSRFDDAQRHFAAAEETHRRIPAPTWLARTHFEWARMLLARRGPGDEERAQHLLGQALETARELGLANVERRVVELLGEIR